MSTDNPFVVGAEVAHWTGHRWIVAKIAKVYKTGRFILEGGAGEQYTPHLHLAVPAAVHHPRGGYSGSRRVEPVTPELRAKIDTAERAYAAKGRAARLGNALGRLSGEEALAMAEIVNAALAALPARLMPSPKEPAND